MIAAAVAAAFCGINAEARQLSPAEALDRVAKESKGGAAVRQGQRAAAYKGISPKMTLRDRQGNNCVYLFSDGGGFMLLSADDCAAPVLGYGDTPLTDTVQMPPAMRAWVRGYMRQIEGAISVGASAYTGIGAESYADIAPMLESRWNQSWPYNNQCPPCSDKDLCVTGCVVTATAQVMYYHKFPAKGTGSHSYTDDINGKSYTLSADFGGSAYDWSLMQPVYNGDSSAESCAEVAKLMAHLGVATEMDYFYGGYNQSGTPLRKAGVALLKYFGYSPSIRHEMKANYTDSDWTGMLYSELTGGRPVIYEGSSESGGHCFVCDGYNAESGMFHFNWGWGGTADGYFPLTALTPNGSDQAGGGNDFTQGQAALFGVRPAQQGDETIPVFFTYGDLVSTTPIGNLDMYMIMGMANTQSPAFYNDTLSPETIPLWTGAEFVSKTDGTAYYISERSSNMLEPYYGNYYISAGITRDVLPAGDYIARPVVCTDDAGKPSGKWRRIGIGADKVSTIDVHVGHHYATFENSLTSQALLKASNADIPDKLAAGQEFTVTADITSHYAGSSPAPRVVLVSPNGTQGELGAYAGPELQLEAGQTASISIDCTIRFTPPEGCVLALADGNEIFYERELSSGVETVKNLKPALRIKDNMLTIDGVAPGEPIRVYSASGYKVVDETPGSSRITIDCSELQRGLYVITTSIGNVTFILK